MIISKPKNDDFPCDSRHGGAAFGFRGAIFSEVEISHFLVVLSYLGHKSKKKDRRMNFDVII